MDFFYSKEVICDFWLEIKITPTRLFITALRAKTPLSPFTPAETQWAAKEPELMINSHDRADHPNRSELQRLLLTFQAESSLSQGALPGYSLPL